MGRGWGEVGFVLPALTSALLLILAQPPFPFFPLSFLALAPLVAALGRVGPGPAGGRSAALLGLSFGLAYWGILLVWVPLVVAPRFPYAYPGYAAQVGLLSGLTALMGWGTWGLYRLRRVPLPLAFPLAWVGMEWLKAHFPMGLAFPWMGLGISLTTWPEALGLAEWVGEAGVSFWLAAVNGLLAAAILSPRGHAGLGSRGRPWVLQVGAAFLLALVPALAGILRARTLVSTPGPRVAVVGTAVPRELRLRPLESTALGLTQAEAALAELESEPESGSVDLVVLPEALVSVPLDGPEGRPARHALERMARALDAPVLVGGLGVGSGLESGTAGGGGARGELTNSAFLLGPRGALVGQYDKVRLVPGMEWGAYSRGRPGTVLRSGEIVLGPLICYESIFGALARAERKAGADLLVNISSDVWFGSEGLSSVFLHQHAAHLVMRAVENRVGVVRAANGGFSTILGPTGEAVAPVVPPSGGLSVGVVPVLKGKTLFSGTGDLVGPAAVLVCLLLGLPLPRDPGLRDP